MTFELYAVLEMQLSAWWSFPSASMTKLVLDDEEMKFGIKLVFMEVC